MTTHANNLWRGKMTNSEVKKLHREVPKTTRKPTTTVATAAMVQRRGIHHRWLPNYGVPCTVPRWPSGIEQHHIYLVLPEDRTLL